MDLRTPLIGGLVLGGLVVVWQFVSAAASLEAVFPLVATAIELVVLLGAMAQTRQTQTYGQQVASGIAVAALACVLIGPGAVAVGASGAEIAAGVIGTLVTGVVIAVVAGFFLRMRPEPAGG